MTIPETALQPEHEYAPTREEIARLAYRYWESQGQPQGSDVQHWLRAERELRTLSRSGGRLRVAVVELPS